MNLSDYIKTLGITDKAFAKMIGVTPVTISRAKSGDVGRVTAKKMIDHSGGKITYKDLYNG
jgi:predicted transcriptional regulator